MVLIFHFLMRNAKIRCGNDIRFTVEFKMTGVLIGRSISCDMYA